MNASNTPPPQKAGSDHTGPTPSTCGSSTTPKGLGTTENCGAKGQALEPITTAPAESDGEDDSKSRGHRSTMVPEAFEPTTTSNAKAKPIVKPTEFPQGQLDQSPGLVLELFRDGRDDDAIHLFRCLTTNGIDVFSVATLEGWPEPIVERLKRRSFEIPIDILEEPHRARDGRPGKPTCAELIDYARARKFPSTLIALMESNPTKRAGDVLILYFEMSNLSDRMNFIRRKAIQWGLDEHTIEDLVIEAIQVVTSRFEERHSIDGLWAYFARTIRNKAIDVHRKKSDALFKAKMLDENCGLDSTINEAEHQVFTAESHHHIIQLIQEVLTPEEGKIFLDRYESGLTQEQIADLTGHPIGTVKSKLSRAMKKLRRSVEPGTGETRNY